MENLLKGRPNGSFNFPVDYSLSNPKRNNQQWHKIAIPLEMKLKK